MPSAGVLLRRFAGPWFGPLSTQGVRTSALWPQRIGTALLTPGCPSRMARWGGGCLRRLRPITSSAQHRLCRGVPNIGSAIQPGHGSRQCGCLNRETSIFASDPADRERWELAEKAAFSRKAPIGGEGWGEGQSALATGYPHPPIADAMGPSLSRGAGEGLAKLLGGLRHLLQVGRIFEVHRGVQLERVLQAQFVADLAHRRHDLMAEEADAGAGILVRDRAVIAPDAVDARPGLFEDAAQFGDDGLRRPAEDAAVGDLLLKGWAAARVLRPPDRELDKVAAQRRREIARRVRPHRVGKAGELALHPEELAGVLLGLFLAVRDVDLLQVAAVLRARLVTGLERDLVVELPDLLGRLDRGVERDVGIALLGCPDDRLLAQHAGDPHPRVGLLQGHRPGIDDPL